MLRIGQFALLGGVTAKALRNYDDRGIFHPAWVDPATAYRYYSPAQLPELRRLVALRDIGVPLAEVAHLLRTGGDPTAVLEGRRRELAAERDRIDSMLRTLDIRIDLESGGPDVVLRSVPPQLVAAVPIDGRPVSDLFDSLERTVLAQKARAPLPPGMLLPADRCDAQIFVPVTRAVETGDVTSSRLPRQRMATALHRGAYEEMGTARSALTDWIESKGLNESDPIRILYLQFGADPDLALPPAYLSDHPGQYVTEIQVPVVD